MLIHFVINTNFFCIVTFLIFQYNVLLRIKKKFQKKCFKLLMLLNANVITASEKKNVNIYNLYI